MELEQAKAIAAALVQELEPYCLRVVVAGSIRRERPFVDDIDLVLIPANEGQLAVKLHELGMKGGTKIVHFLYRSAPVDIYFADKETFPMLLLVRTGSTAHNKWLAGRAKRMGLHFAADGRGIVKLAYGDPVGTRVAWHTEEEILRALGLAFIPPEQRERL